MMLAGRVTNPPAGRPAASVICFATPGNTASKSVNPAPSPARQEVVVALKDAKTQAFVQWCLSTLAVSCDKLEPATFNGLRGMAASKTIDLEDILISIPRSSAIVLSPKMKCPCTDFVTSDYWNKQPWYVKMAVMLLYEKSLGQKSKLANYVEQLPQSYEAPVLWNDQQLQRLQYPALIEKVKKQRKDYEQQHQQLCQGLVQGQQPISLQQFLWAICAVRSRTFSGPYIGTSLKDRVRLAGLVGVLAVANVTLGLADVERTLTAAIAVFVFNVLYEVILSQSLKQYAMAPLVDFINHSATTQSEVSLDYFTDRYSVTAGKAFRPGEQVFISYGNDQTNDSLMQFYGFVEPDNTADTYTMTRLQQWLPQHVQVNESRMQQLQTSGQMTSLQEVVVARTGFPASTLNTLRYLLADESAAAAGPAAFTGPGGDAAEQKLAEVLVNLVQDELAAMGTTLEQDMALLSGSTPKKGLTVEERLAMQFRSEKKKILQATLTSLGVAA